MNRTLTGLARAAYQAYGDERGWKTWDDRDMPEWLDLTQEIQLAWSAAARAVRDLVDE